MEAVVRKLTSFRLREDLLQVLQEHARKANRSLNNFVESALMDAVYTDKAFEGNQGKAAWRFLHDERQAGEC